MSSTPIRDSDFFSFCHARDKLKQHLSHIFYCSQVPFGSLAFMPGKLVHTNEIMVLLGENWFTERSASQALEIVARRKKCTVINFMYMVMLIDDGGLV